jgi:hypothetical protein
MTTGAALRLQADLKAISQEPPEGCSASPASDDNLFVSLARLRKFPRKCCPSQLFFVSSPFDVSFRSGMGCHDIWA